MERHLRVLVLEPPNQLLPTDTARPNGALGPAYLVGALRAAGVEADYFDGTVGRPGEPLEQTFFNRLATERGTIRYGVTTSRLADVISTYDIVATSSIFTAQTRMHFEVAAVVARVRRETGRPRALISGGVNARALREHFLNSGFDVVALGDGEATIVDLVRAYATRSPDLSKIAGIAYRVDGRTVVQPVGMAGKQRLEAVPPPALEALPLDVYQRIGIPHAGVMPPGTRFAALQTSRGCQDRCAFCHISAEKANVAELGPTGFLREFTDERVRQDVDRAVALGIRRLYFEDDNLFFSKARLRRLAPALTRPGLEYSNVNGANLRFLFRKTGDRYEVDTEFIAILADFGLKELVMPFEARSADLMKKYATGKYNADIMDSVALVRALKDAGLRIAGNFMIGFRDESWESVLATKEFARQLLDAGLDAAGFMIPVPYPGSLDFEVLMQDAAVRRAFEADVLSYTDRMHWRARPLFPTRVPPDRLRGAIHEFWLELNSADYTAHKMERNVGPLETTAQGVP